MMSLHSNRRVATLAAPLDDVQGLRSRVRRVAGPLVSAVAWIRNRKARRELTQWLETVSVPFGGFENKVVLDVGTDLPGTLAGFVAKRFAPREIIGINPAATDRTIAPNARLEKGDILHTRFPDAYFDLIFSSSAFEHITGLDRGLAEMHRILKPGGFLFSHFGPIWSTSYGHHMWVTHKGRLYTYWDIILPPFSHLLMPAAEIESLLIDRKYDRELSRIVGEYVTSSPEQNQLFFEDYEELVARSDFEAVFFKGYDHPEMAAIYNAHVDAALLDRLKAAYPGRKNFSYDGITMLLRKRITGAR